MLTANHRAKALRRALLASQAMKEAGNAMLLETNMAPFMPFRVILVIK